MNVDTSVLIKLAKDPKVWATILGIILPIVGLNLPPEQAGIVVAVIVGAFVGGQGLAQGLTKLGEGLILAGDLVRQKEGEGERTRSLGEADPLDKALAKYRGE